MSKVVIIGNGIAGITAARHIRKKSDHRIVVISAESKYFFSRTALMYVYMGHMKYEHTQPYENWFWRKNEIELIQARVREVMPEQNKIQLSTQELLSYDYLILALGSKPRELNLGNSGLKGIQSLYSLQDLQLMETNTLDIKNAAVVGGGLIGIEMAEMLHSRGIHVTLVVREKNYWDMVLPLEESEMINRHIRSRGVDLKLECQMRKIIGKDRVEAIELEDKTLIVCQFLGITIGVDPNITLLENSSIAVNKGVLVNEFLQTNHANIYAIGDCAEIVQPPTGHKSIEAVWYTGRLMGEHVAETICENAKPYTPGNWFNSAKFFDLEYQTYGYTPVTRADGFDSYFWQDIKHERCLRITYNSAKQVVGFNALGIRLNHEVCDAWITTGKPLDFVLKNLSEINFNAEFSRKIETKVPLNTTS